MMPIARCGPRSSAACRPTRGSVARHTRKAFLEPTAGMPRSGTARPGRGLAGRQSPLSYFPKSVVLTTGSASQYVIFQLVEVAVPRDLFAAVLARIGRLAMQPAVCPNG